MSSYKRISTSTEEIDFNDHTILLNDDVRSVPVEDLRPAFWKDPEKVKGLIEEIDIRKFPQLSEYGPLELFLKKDGSYTDLSKAIFERSWDECEGATLSDIFNAPACFTGCSNLDLIKNAMMILNNREDIGDLKIFTESDLISQDVLKNLEEGNNGKKILFYISPNSKFNGVLDCFENRSLEYQMGKNINLHDDAVVMVVGRQEDLSSDVFSRCFCCLEDPYSKFVANLDKNAQVNKRSVEVLLDEEFIRLPQQIKTEGLAKLNYATLFSHAVSPKDSQKVLVVSSPEERGISREGNIDHQLYRLSDIQLKVPSEWMISFSDELTEIIPLFSSHSSSDSQIKSHISEAILEDGDRLKAFLETKHCFYRFKRSFRYQRCFLMKLVRNGIFVLREKNILFQMWFYDTQGVTLEQFQRPLFT